MKIGAMIPAQEVGNDPVTLKDFAQGAEELGFDHLLLTDHVLQVDRADYPDAFSSYSINDAFQEPFVTYGYIAAVTEKIEMSTGILMLPQRQAVLAAKQAAQLDFLSGGRLRLGVGVGWQEIEFDALSAPWKGRGKLCEEKIEVMRGLWNNELFEFEGEFHTVPRSGLNPNSIQKPIPIWFGGMSDAVAERTGRMGDGWIQVGTPERLKPQFEIMYEAAEKAGRSRKDIGIETIYGLKSPIGDDVITMDQCLEQAKLWVDAGGTHFTFGSLGLGYTSVDQHLKLASEFKERLQSL